MTEAAPLLDAARPMTGGRIPVRNLWLLLLYASDLACFGDRFDAAVEESPDLPDLIARLLCSAVEHRLRRNLSRGYRRVEAVMSRVRGRIDLLKTESEMLLLRGKVACRFEEHTIDTPRNRLVRSALDALSSRLTEPDLAHRCRIVAGDLGRLGVSGVRPSRASIVSDQIGRHDADDRLMVELARLVFDLMLPTEDAGDYTLTRAERDDILIRKLFEKAVGNFYAAELRDADGWRVWRGKRFDWPVEDQTPGMAAILPGMKTDIILENWKQNRRTVIDTKFTGILTRTPYRENVLKSDYLYQMYAYLRSQEGKDDLSGTAEGWLLHPAFGATIDETVRIQSHNIRFVTIDLMQPIAEILRALRNFTRENDIAARTPTEHTRLTV
jgi:5-methylcytosine-specific restriction enzyme subunit McrC